MGDEKEQEENNTVTLPAEPSPIVAEEKPTSTEMQEAGLSPEEIKSAEERGLSQKPGEENKPGDGKPDDPKKSDEDPEKKQDDPDPTKDEDPESEHKKLDDFTSREKASYFKAKREKTKRQAAQAERDRVLLQNKRNEERISALEQKIKEGDKPGEGNVLDDEGSGAADKPLTKTDLEEFENEKLEKERKVLEEKKARGSKLQEAIADQELEAKEKHEDFEKVTALTNDIFKNANNLEKMFPDRARRRGIESLISEFLARAGSADSIEEGEETAAEIGYEIGRLHPDYKKLNANGSESGEGKTGAPANDPEKVKRALGDNRPSSASLSGSAGSRVVSVDNLTTQDVLDLPHAEFIKLRKEHPQAIERLLKGG